MKPQLQKVAFDVSSLTHRQISGVGVYTVELFRALSALGGPEITPFYRLARWKYRTTFRQHVGAVRPWLSGWGMGAEVVHGPDFRVVPTRRMARVVTVHDLAFLREGLTSAEFGRKKGRDLDRLLAHSPPDAVITVSEATKRDLLSRYPNLKDRTFAVHLGGDHLKSASVAEGDRGPDDVFLFVGNLEARKNVILIIKAFEAHQALSTRLVLVGKTGFQGEEILRAVEQSPLRHRIELVGYCPNEQLERYYRRALALVYPSIVEGFGIPVLEAMRLGCPVITSATTACAEIVGDKAWLVDPEKVSEIARAMDEAYALKAEPGRRLAFIEAARAHAAQFTWRRCAERTVEVYRWALGRL